MLRSNFTIAPFEQSPYAYRSGIVEIAAHMDFKADFLSFEFKKGYAKTTDKDYKIKLKEIENFIWAFGKDFFARKSDVRRYCCGKTFVRKTRTHRTYGIVIEGTFFKYNVRVDNNTDKDSVNFYIVVNEKASVAAA